MCRFVVVLLLSALLLPAVSLAETEQAESPATPPAAQPPSFATALEIEPTAGDEPVTFNLEDATLLELVRLVSNITGRRFIVSPKVRDLRASVFAPKAITADEAYRAFLSILQVNGLTVERAGRFEKIVESTDPQRGNLRLRTEGRPGANDGYVTQLYRVKHGRIDALSQLLGQLKSKEGSLLAYAPTDSLILTDTGFAVRRMLDVLQTLDVPRAAGQVWLEPLRHAEASDLATRIGEVLGAAEPEASSTPASTRKTSGKRPRGKKTAAAAAAVSIEGGGSQAPGSVLPEPRTNSLLIVGTRPFYLRVLELVRALDVPLSGDGTVHVHKLQHAKAEDLAATVSSLLGNQKASKGAKAGDNPLAGLFEGPVAVTADAPTNALVVTSSARDYKALAKVIAGLDAPRRQVFIEAVIMDLDDDASRALGVNLHGGLGNVAGDGSVAFAGSNAAESLLSSLSSETLTGLAVGLVGPDIPGTSFDSFRVELNALAARGSTHILSTPHLIALENEEAEINIIENTPVQGNVTGGINPLAALGASGTEAAGLASALNTATSVPRQDVGIRIRLTPHVNDRGDIHLEIDQESSSLGSPVEGNANAVSIRRRTAKTQVVVADAETVVIGGLVSETFVDAERKVPVLGDIPLLGALFRSTTKQRKRSNLLIFLTPYLVDSRDDLRAIYARKMQERQTLLDRELLFGDKPMASQVGRPQRGLVAELLRHHEQVQPPAVPDTEPVAEPPPRTAREPILSAAAR